MTDNSGTGVAAGTRYSIEELRKTATLVKVTYAAENDMADAWLAMVETLEAADVLMRCRWQDEADEARSELKDALSRFDFSRPGKSAPTETETTDGGRR